MIKRMSDKKRANKSLGQFEITKFSFNTYAICRCLYLTETVY